MTPEQMQVQIDKLRAEREIVRKAIRDFEAPFGASQREIKDAKASLARQEHYIDQSLRNYRRDIARSATSFKVRFKRTPEAEWADNGMRFPDAHDEAVSYLWSLSRKDYCDK